MHLSWLKVLIPSFFKHTDPNLLNRCVCPVCSFELALFNESIKLSDSIVIPVGDKRFGEWLLNKILILIINNWKGRGVKVWEPCGTTGL